MTRAAPPTTPPVAPSDAGAPGADARPGALRVALVGNPNTGKTTLFNRLSGLRHKTSNFPGTTQEARVGLLAAHVAPHHAREGDLPAVHLIDLPGVYSLELELSESRVAREVLAGSLAPSGEQVAPPDAVCVVLDGANLPRNLVLAGEVLRRRLPTLVVVNMIDVARRQGLVISTERLSAALGCPVVACVAREGEGVPETRALLHRGRVPNVTPPGTREGLEAWAERVYAEAVAGAREGDASAAGARGAGAGASASVGGMEAASRAGRASFTDRLDRTLVHPVLGLMVFALVMTGLFWSIFKLATYPMDWIDAGFAWAVVAIEGAMPAGLLRDFLSQGVVAGVGATVVFVPQIALLFFLIALLEDTGYLARATLLMDRVLRPFGLPGHAFVPLLSSHACALPGIMATRAIPDRRDRLATILVAPFMTCSARLPVYVLVTTVLFPRSPGLAALAFIGCYALGIAAGLLSAVLIRGTLLKGPRRPMLLELPTYKRPSVRTALLTTYDRAWTFLKNAGTVILAICVVLWWLSAFPRVEPPREAVELRERAAVVTPASGTPAPRADASPATPTADDLLAEAARLEARHAQANSFAGMIGRAVQPVFAPMGADWQLTIGIVTSFAAREVFVSTMAVIVTGEGEESEGVVERIATAERTDGSGPVFNRPASWAVLVFYVLAMQCLPTLAVTAREAGGAKWALLQFAWMSGVAYVAATLVYQVLRALGM